MKKVLALFILLAIAFAGCKSSIEVFEEGTTVVTRKFGPSDLEKLGGRLMQRLKESKLSWLSGKPRVAILDFRNKTDKPGLNKQPFFDEIETAMFSMNKFDLIDYQETKKLLDEAGYQQSDVFDNNTAVAMGKAVRVRYVMWGDVSVSSDIGADNRMIKQYRLSLKITDVETHKIAYRDTEKALLKAVD